MPACRPLAFVLLFLAIAHIAEARCVENPLTTKLPRIKFEKTSAINILVSVAQDAHVCLGVEGASELRTPASLNASDLTYLQLLQRLAPMMQIHVAQSVVNICRITRARSNWMDMSLLMQTDRPEDINWVAYWLLGSQMYARARPKFHGGIAGATPGAGVKVGPYPKQFRPARNWLNQIIIDGGGGCWFTPLLWLRHEGPPPLKAWTVLLYSTSPNFNQRAVTDDALWPPASGVPELRE